MLVLSWMHFRREKVNASMEMVIIIQVIWKEGKPEGKGIYTYANGVALNGEWKDGKFIDKKTISEIFLR
jgi:hypothetical protein